MDYEAWKVMKQGELAAERAGTGDEAFVQACVRTVQVAGEYGASGSLHFQAEAVVRREMAIEMIGKIAFDALLREREQALQRQHAAWLEEQSLANNLPGSILP